jgi:hypothetical protein
MNASPHHTHRLNQNAPCSPTDTRPTRNTNKINAYLSRPLVPVSNGRDGVPPALKPLTSLEAIRTLAREDVDKWLEYYTGARGGGVDEQGARQALRACVGVDVSML